MAKEQSGDQTEKPTPKRLRDARKEGNVAKSRELSGTVTLLCWLVAAWLAVPLVRGQLQELFQRFIDSIGTAAQVGPRGLQSIYELGWQPIALRFFRTGVENRTVWSHIHRNRPRVLFRDLPASRGR